MTRKNSFWKDQWLSSVEVFKDFYSIETLKKDKWPDMIFFAFSSIVIVALFHMWYSLLKQLIPNNFTDGFFSLVLLVFFILFICAVTALMFFSLHEKYSWFIPYTILVGIIMLLFYWIPIWNSIVSIILLLLFLPSMHQQWKLSNKAIIITVVLILIVLVIGTNMIEGLYGFKTSNPVTFEECTNRSNSFQMNCLTPKGEEFTDSMLTCELPKEMTFLGGNITYIYRNGSQTEKEFNLNIYAKEDIETMRFHFNVNKNDGLVCITGSHHPSYISQERYHYNQDKFITYLLGLLFVSFVTIPKMVIEFKKEF